jgi:hypothetical protein
MLTETANVQCPACWETIEVVVDCSVEEQEYTEDCSVCCRPMIVTVNADDGELQSVDVRSEDD